MWAFTSNFSIPQQFAEIDSKPITVTARELGTNIPRSKIYKTYAHDERKRSNRLHLGDQIKAPGSPASPKTEIDESSLVESGCGTRSDDVGAISLTIQIEPPDSAPTTISEVNSSPNTTELIDGVEITVDNDHILEVATGSISTPTEEAVSKSQSNRDYYLSPNEPVFLGAKKYSPFFCFWQVKYVLDVFLFPFKFL